VRSEGGKELGSENQTRYSSSLVGSIKPREGKWRLDGLLDLDLDRS
jgi:hypothetical protein